MKLKQTAAAVLAALTMLTVFSSCGDGGASKTEGTEVSSQAAGVEAAAEDSGAKVKSLDDLDGKAIGVQLGTVGDIYAEDYENATVEKYQKGADAVQALNSGKIDAVIIDEQPAMEFVRKNPGIAILDEKFEPEEYAVAIKKGNDELTNEINGALAQLREDGTLDAITDYWINKNEDAVRYEVKADADRSKGKLIMATNAEFPPYELKEGEEIVGFDVDMMKAVCDVLGYELQIDDIAFDSIIVAVDTGKADVGVAGMTVTEDRLKNVNFSDAYTTAQQVVLVKGETPAPAAAVNDSGIASLDDLDGKAIGVQLGTVGDIYAEDYENATVEKYQKGADAVQALNSGKIDAVIIDEQPAMEFVRKNPGIAILDEKFEPEEYAVAIKKGNDELTNEINGALAQLREDGTLDAITDYWINKNEDAVRYEVKADADRSKGKLIMATNAEFPPYELKEGEEIVGFDVDMMKAVCDVLGYELQIDDIAFDSIIVAVDTGKADVGVAGMTVTEDRLKNVNFSDAYTTAQQVVLVRTAAETVSESDTEAKGTAVTTADEDTSLKGKFENTFKKDGRWHYLTKGLGNTLFITVFAVVIGIILGFLIAIVRSTHDKTGKLKILNLLARVYLTVIRGTPVVVQLMILYFVVFVSVNSTYSIYVAVLAFGLNSAAYVAEIVRSGIMSIDGGQFEAGASLGLSYPKTMRYIILPQAFKNVLPALANEFIVLLKETSVAGYIAIQDLTKGGDIIRSQTYEAFMPLIAVAVIYLVMVIILTKLVSMLEAHLKKSER